MNVSENFYGEEAVLKVFLNANFILFIISVLQTLVDLYLRKFALISELKIDVVKFAFF
jgi:hypothetical protein